MKRIITVGLLVGLGLALVGSLRLVQQVDSHVELYQPYKNALYHGLKYNDFAYAYANEEDLAYLRRELSFLEEAPTDHERVIALVKWIHVNIDGREINSVRARDIYDQRAGACEVHTFAVAALAAFDVRARWICSVKSSMGFGYLEAFADGEWRLYQLRDANRISMDMSAWDLFEASEPSLSIRTFWSKPGQKVETFEGSVYPAILPFASVRRHPELETIFRTERGLDVTYDEVNPEAFPFTYRGKADGQWVTEERVADKFFGIVDGEKRQRRKLYGDLADLMGKTSLEDDPIVPEEGPRRVSSL